MLSTKYFIIIITNLFSIMGTFFSDFKNSNYDQSINDWPL